MAWYLVEIRYVQEKLEEVRPRHREFLAQLVSEGILAIAGPLADNTGGVMLYQAADRDSLQSLLDRDPYAVEGVIAERTIREYKPVLGSWLP